MQLKTIFIKERGMNVEEVKRQIMEAGYSAYTSGLVSAAGGNISMRLGNRYFITATNVPLGKIKPEDIVEVDGNGNLIGEDYGGKRPSKEVLLHLAVFRNRPDIDSVIHVHPVYSIICTIAFQNEFPVLTVSGLNKLGTIGYIPFAQAGSEQLVLGAEKAIRENDESLKTILMEQHGIIVFEKGMDKCLQRTELMEDTAKIAIYSSLMKKALGKN